MKSIKQQNEFLKCGVNHSKKNNGGITLIALVITIIDPLKFNRY